jgi:hypothetical protein
MHIWKQEMILSGREKPVRHLTRNKNKNIKFVLQKNKNKNQKCQNPFHDLPKLRGKGFWN